ncbi:MAG: hypothetical protein FWG64_07325 [Firmicutes bacterium]|nr:hypothetical protein [Bacillota bacterium]
MKKTKITKIVMACLLTLTFAIAAVPQSVFAAETQPVVAIENVDYTEIAPAFGAPWVTIREAHMFLGPVDLIVFATIPAGVNLVEVGSPINNNGVIFRRMSTIDTMQVFTGWMRATDLHSRPW